MPKLKILSGSEIIKIFLSFGFEIVNQKGGHIKIRRLKNSIKETLMILNHKQVDTGTTRAIMRQASKYIPLEILQKHFYI